MPFPPERPTPTFPYQIEARIGEGAMGVVYRAIEPALERRVAIKSLRAQMLSGEEHLFELPAGLPVRTKPVRRPHLWSLRNAGGGTTVTQVRRPVPGHP